MGNQKPNDLYAIDAHVLDRFLEYQGTWYHENPFQEIPETSQDLYHRAANKQSWLLRPLLLTYATGFQ